MSQKILFAISSHGRLGDTGKGTGYYLNEASHPWKILSEAGYQIEYVSPKGGTSPIDGWKPDDEINLEFLNDEDNRQKVNNAMTPDEVDPKDYAAIHYVGGHGTMWDFPENEKLAEIAVKIYENGGAISAVCHGPSGLVNIKLSDGSYLIDGKNISTFTNEEEKEAGLTDVVPFLLESKLQERGAKIHKAGNFEEKVTVDGRLVTGQNEFSAKKLARELKNVLQSELEPAE